MPYLSTLLFALVVYWPSAWRSHGAAVWETALAIEHATDLPSERAALATLALYETTLGARGIPFGCSGCRRRASPEEAAPGALVALREGLSRCRTWERAFAWYHLGRCTAGAWERAERRTHARLVGALGMLSLRPW